MVLRCTPTPIAPLSHYLQMTLGMVGRMRVNRKFQKVRQVWLLKHAYNKSKVPKTSFGILLEYAKGIKGVSRQVYSSSHACPYFDTFKSQ
jgi:hypothetical protein